MLTQSLGRQHEIRLDQLRFLRCDLRELFFSQAFSIVWHLIRTKNGMGGTMLTSSVNSLPDVFQIAN